MHCSCFQIAAALINLRHSAFHQLSWCAHICYRARDWACSQSSISWVFSENWQICAQLGLWFQDYSAEWCLWQMAGPLAPLFRNDQAWEGTVVEAPFLWKHAGRYYMFYSGMPVHVACDVLPISGLCNYLLFLNLAIACVLWHSCCRL